MVERERKYSINVTYDQHETIVGMKRGKDTVYDVVDRLLSSNSSLDELEAHINSLGLAIVDLIKMTRELKEVIENGNL